MPHNYKSTSRDWSSKNHYEAEIRPAIPKWVPNSVQFISLNLFLSSPRYQYYPTYCNGTAEHMRINNPEKKIRIEREVQYPSAHLTCQAHKTLGLSCNLYQIWNVNLDANTWSSPLKCLIWTRCALCRCANWQSGIPKKKGKNPACCTLRLKWVLRGGPDPNTERLGSKCIKVIHQLKRIAK